jgi:hypothetical protein
MNFIILVSIYNMYNLLHYSILNNLFLNGSFFIQIKKIKNKKTSMIEEFLNYINSLETIEKNILIKNFNNIYILVAEKYGSIYETDILKWNNLLSIEEYNKLNNNKYYIIGYILLKRNIIDDNIIYIDIIKSRIEKINLNISIYMIEKLKLIYKKEILPYEINDNNNKYWKKILSNIIDTIPSWNKYKEYL